MKRTWRDGDIDLACLRSRTVAIIGYAIQGRAQALNLRDSGIRVIVGGREGGRGITAARNDGFEAFVTSQAVARADVVFLLTPDDTHVEVLSRDINPAIRRPAVLGFACGFSITFSDVGLPDGVDVVMVAPKGPGRVLRERFVAGGGLPALVAVERDASGAALDVALAYAGAIGCGRLGVIESTFAEEAETDLFGEQAVLCGGIPRLMEAGFETLVEAGYSPEAAYIECIWEAKAIVDLVFERGIDAMYAEISPTARYGGLTRGTRVIGPEAKHGMRGILAGIKSGEFAEELSATPLPKAAPETPRKLKETWARLKELFKP